MKKSTTILATGLLTLTTLTAASAVSAGHKDPEDDCGRCWFWCNKPEISTPDVSGIRLTID